MNGGMVYLIGAGPGDPELVTLKAARALARCDVVLIDDLVHRDVLQLCRPGVRVVEVGKRCGCRSTLVIYMGVRRLAEITRALLAAGMSPATPAAAIQNGTLPEQVNVVSTLGRVARDVVERGIGSPAIVVIGDVVALARQERKGSVEAAPASMR